MLYFAHPSHERASVRLRRFRRVAIHVFRVTLLALICHHLVAQSGTATLSGVITDSRGALIPDAQVVITNEDTGATTEKKTNNAGIYNAPALIPGRYYVVVAKDGFKQVDLRDVTLNVQDTVSRNFTLEVGGTSETVQVDGSGVNINTTDATVSTVIDRQFVEGIPMNGRSFQTLVLLSPGVVTATPQPTSASGEFSVNGQRTDANNNLLDGLSAQNSNNAIQGGAGTAGMTANATVLGTTQAIVSVDALQEFRIATSTYSAEFGRQPGAQISYQSRSGSNAYHGTAFDYLRNYVFDANSWFNNHVATPLARPQERQNDFGGVLGGPLSVPRLFSGKDRAFFFFSYEGLRLNQPQAATVAYVPSNGTNNTGTYSNPFYTNLRANAPAALQPVMKAFPQSNCTTAQYAQCIDYGDGLSPYLFSGVAPSSLDAIMARLDFQMFPWLRTFVRYNDTESSAVSISSGTWDPSATLSRVRSYVLGADAALSGNLTNQLRLQYSPNLWQVLQTPTASNGTQPVNLKGLEGQPAGGESVFYFLYANNQPGIWSNSYGTKQFQPNAVDTLSWTHGPHFFKAGADYRQTTAYLGDGSLSRSPWEVYYFESSDDILQNSATEIVGISLLRQDPTFKNLGLFFQDEWHLRPRLSLSLGLRWDLNPAPSVSGAMQYTYQGNIDNLSSLTLAPLGTPFYGTTYNEFAPRFGVAATLRAKPGRELVFRAGGGLFYDTGQAQAVVFGNGDGLGTGTWLYFGKAYNKPQGFPLPPNALTILAPTTPYSLGYLPDRNFSPPSTVQWSASLEQELGQKQSIILSYVAAEGMSLTHWSEYQPGSINPLFSTFFALRNGPGSNYNSLQLQYKRQVFHGLQAQASYTWSRAIDSASTDYYGSYVLQRGNSDQDVRNNFTAAAVYNLPSEYGDHLQRMLLGNWNIDMLFVARSAFPIQIQGPNTVDPVNGYFHPSQLNYNGKNPYLYKEGIPGGRQVNPDVFSVPLASQNGNGNAPRNFVRGFGEAQANMAIQRAFPLYEQVRLQFRVDAFNLLNHPNFGVVNVTCGAKAPGAACNNPTLGQATNILANSLNGLSPIYQMGGARSLQLALKLQF